MASTASEIIATAQTEAEAARQSALSSLSGLSSSLQSGYETQQQATSNYYTNMLNNLQNAYNQDARGAYATSMIDRQSVANSLNRLGLANSGRGVSQMLDVGSTYSKNLANLQNTLRTNRANLGAEQQQALADLYNNYTNNRIQLDQYLYEAGQNAYDTAYANRYQAEQDAIANALQQQYYNYLMSSARYGGGGGGGSSSSGSGSSDVNLGGGSSSNKGSSASAPEGYTRDLSALVSSLGYSRATSVEDLIREGVIDTDVIDGVLYYREGVNANRDVGIDRLYR